MQELLVITYTFTVSVARSFVAHYRSRYWPFNYCSRVMSSTLSPQIIPVMPKSVRSLALPWFHKSNMGVPRYPLPKWGFNALLSNS